MRIKIEDYNEAKHGYRDDCNYVITADDFESANVVNISLESSDIFAGEILQFLIDRCTVCDYTTEGDGVWFCHHS